AFDPSGACTTCRPWFSRYWAVRAASLRWSSTRSTTMAGAFASLTPAIIDGSEHSEAVPRLHVLLEVRQELLSLLGGEHAVQLDRRFCGFVAKARDRVGMLLDEGL